MTNKEAIEIIKVALAEVEWNYPMDYSIAFEKAIESLENDWVPCSKRMPEEHDSVFLKLYGTNKWSDLMWKKCSDEVNVTVEYEDGVRIIKTMRTHDGKWAFDRSVNRIKFTVIAWMPMPKEYQGD